MTIGNFTRANLENTVSGLASDWIDLFNRAEKLRSRCAAELAAGTLDGADFYGSDAPDKANVLGALDDIHAVYQAVQNLQALPAKDYRLYLDHMIGI
jgi:hypothetical protein